MARRNRRLIGLVLLSTLLVSCSHQNTSNGSNQDISLPEVTTSEVTTSTHVVTTAPTLKGALIEASSADLLKMIANKESFLMYFGTTTCSHCIQFKEDLRLDILVNHDITIYAAIIDYENKTFEDDVLALKLKIESTPTVAVIKDGEVIQTAVGTQSAEQLENLYDLLK